MEKKYFTIYKQIKNAILKGTYAADTKLPSKRVMANKYGCSVITIETAYHMLADEGYITSMERSGYFVCHIDTMNSHTTKIRPADFEYLDETPDMSQVPNFEYSLWFKTIRKVIAERGEQLFIKSPNMGCAVLRNALSDYLYHYRGMHAEPQRIIIGSGAEQLYETAVTILGREHIYGIEDPSYHRIEAVYKSVGVTTRKLPLSNTGISKDDLFQSDIKVLHVTPFRSYPTNVSISVPKRYEYLRWASQGNYIIAVSYTHLTLPTMAVV